MTTVDEQEPVVMMLRGDMKTAQKQARCACGEPEDGGEFGWFTSHDEDGAWRTYCNACGSEIGEGKKP